MFNRAEMKNAAKAQLKGRWGSIIVAMLIIGIIIIAISIFSALSQISPLIGIDLTWLYWPTLLISILISGPITLGISKYCLKFVSISEKVELGEVFFGFEKLGKSIGLCLWYTLWTLLWSILLIIPGIIKSLAYSQCFYIMAENPNISIRQALKTSIKMTKGYKGDIFIMGLSFIGWTLLAAIPLYLGYLWLVPYMYVTYTNMYLRLKEMALESGACTLSDFGITE